MLNFCTKCGNKLEGNPSFCPECGHPVTLNVSPVNMEKKVEYQSVPQPQPGEIKCPYCNQFFSPPKTWTGEIKPQKTTSTSGNIVRGAIFLPWGVVKAATNKKFLICPHCKMKIMQG